VMPPVCFGRRGVPGGCVDAGCGVVGGGRHWWGGCVAVISSVPTSFSAIIVVVLPRAPIVFFFFLWSRGAGGGEGVGGERGRARQTEENDSVRRRGLRDLQYEPHPQGQWITAGVRRKHE